MGLLGTGNGPTPALAVGGPRLRRPSAVGQGISRGAPAIPTLPDRLCSYPAGTTFTGARLPLAGTTNLSRRTWTTTPPAEFSGLTRSRTE